MCLCARKYFTLHTHTLNFLLELISDNLGTVGMLLSVPLTMIVKIALETSQEGRWLATLLGNGEELKLED